MVQWASCLCLELAIPQTSGWWGMQYIGLNNNTYLLWFQASEKNTGFFVVWTMHSCAYYTFLVGFFSVTTSEGTNHLITKGQGSGTCMVHTLWGCSAIKTKYFATSLWLLNSPCQDLCTDARNIFLSLWLWLMCQKIIVIITLSSLVPPS